MRCTACAPTSKCQGKIKTVTVFSVFVTCKIPICEKKLLLFDDSLNIDDEFVQFDVINVNVCLLIKLW